MAHINYSIITKTRLLFFGFLIFLVIGMAGCQKADQTGNSLEDVSQVSLQRLAEMQSDQTVDKSLYDDIDKRIVSLDDQEYNIFLQEWAKADTARALELGVVSKSEKKQALKDTLEELQLRNKKAKELYGKSMNKLSGEEQENVLRVLQKEEKDAEILSGLLLYTGISDEVANLSPQDVAHMMFQETDDPRLYFDVWNKVMSFSEEEHDVYYTTLLNRSIQEMIDLEIISEDERAHEVEASNQKRLLYDEKAMQKFGKLFYQLSFKQAFNLEE